MASIYKRNTRNWYASFIDARGVRVERSTGTTDRRLAESIARKWETDADARRAGLVDPRAEAIAASEARDIGEHLADFLHYLEGKGTSTGTIDAADARIGFILERAGVERIADLTPSAVVEAIREARESDTVKPGGISNRTATHYLRAVKSFSRWLVRDRRTASDALAHLAGYNDATDRRRVRRDLEADELHRIADAASRSPAVTVARRRRDPESGEVVVSRYRLTCPERVWAYRIAAGTGLRAGEVSSLTPESFDLEADPPTVTVEAAYSKRRRRDTQPMRHDLADALRPWLAGKPPRVPVCPVPKGRGGLLLRSDMETARASWLAESRSPAERERRESSDFLRHIDSAGRVADFHGLRHTFISRVVASGASVKVAQELARHSTPNLTIGRYSHVRLHDLSAALEAVPGPTPERKAEAMRATGTYDAPPPQNSRQSSRETPRLAATRRDDDDAEPGEKPVSKSLVLQGFRVVTRADATVREKCRWADSNRRPPGYESDMTPAIHDEGETPPANLPASDPDFGTDPDLAAVVAAWADLPPAIRAGVVAMVRAATGD